MPRGALRDMDLCGPRIVSRTLGYFRLCFKFASGEVGRQELQPLQMDQESIQVGKSADVYQDRQGQVRHVVVVIVYVGFESDFRLKLYFMALKLGLGESTTLGSRLAASRLGRRS